MKTKKCTKCGEEKSLIGFHRDCTKKDGRCSSCKQCQSTLKKNHYSKNKLDVLARNKQWRLAHKQTIKEMSHRKYIKNKEQLKTHIYGKRARKILSNTYVKQLLTKRSVLQNKDVPQELVETKREHLKLGRLLKGTQNENNEGSKRKIS